MGLIKIQLLQTPKITVDGVPVTLPFKKAEGLLYYLAVQKTTSREQAAALFWASTEEATAKKNLRHALYTIKKALGDDIILSPQKQVLTLNQALAIETDYDNFKKSGNTDLYQGDFLEGFYVKNAEGFDEWMTMERSALRDTYLQKLFERMSQLKRENLSEAEACFHRYTREDPLDERIYYLMMQTYQLHHLYHKGIKVYQNLSKLLNTELRISPGKEIAALYRTLLNSWTEETAEQTLSAPVSICGRQKEVQALTQYYHHFLSGKATAVFLSGENGVGKTHLIHHFLDDLENDNCLILRNICFGQDQNIIFHPWNTVMMQVDQYIQQHHLKIPHRYLQTISSLFPMFGNSGLLPHVAEDIEISYNLRAARNSILKLFTLIGAEIPIILFFDNIHFLDTYSLELLAAMIQDQNPNIMILGTHLDIVNTTMQKYISALAKEHLIQQLELKPFTREAVQEFVEERLGKDALNAHLLDQIYKETEGNAFFLENVLTQFSDSSMCNVSMIQVQNILSDRILAVSKEARQILDIVSLFHDYTTLDLIEFISNQDTFEILSLLEELKEHALIKEALVNNEIRFQFRHLKMQEFVHAELSHAKRRLLHKRVTEYLLHCDMPRTNYWYDRLIHHYTLCGDEPNTLKYRILELEELSSYHFDLYPVLGPSMESSSQLFQRLTDTFEELKTSLYQLCRRYPSAIDYSESEARLLYLSGKFYISQGEYQDGIPAIRQVLQNEFTKNTPHFYIQCLRQLTYYGIQIWDTELMQESILKCMEAEQANHFDIDYAIECRLYGLYWSMTGNYTNAEQYLTKALEGFRVSPLKAQSYALNIAACYNYLGETYRKQKDFSSAVAYYEKAIGVCRKEESPVSPTFYTNLARAYLGYGQIEKGRESLKTAARLYDDSTVIMGRAIAESYASCLEAYQDNFEKAETLLKEAMDIARRLSCPLDLGLLSLAGIVLLSRFPGKFDHIIGTSLTRLTDLCKSYLSRIAGCYELEELNRLLV